MVNFFIPYNEGLRLCNLALLEAIKEHREWFYDDFTIPLLYGSPGKLIWNGTIPNNEHYVRPYKFQLDIVSFYRQGMQLCVVCSNFMLKPQHLYDVYGNAVLQDLNEAGGGVLVSTELMAKYVRTHYPELFVFWSSYTDFGTDVERQIIRINSLSEKDMVVLPTRFNNKFGILDKFIHPENIAIVLNDPCPCDCPYRKEHVTNIALYNCYVAEESHCFLRERKPFAVTDLDWGHIVNRNVLNQYVAHNFTKFVVAGRGKENQYVFNAYSEHFVKPHHYGDFTDFINKFLDEKEKNDKAARDAEKLYGKGKG